MEKVSTEKKSKAMAEAVIWFLCYAFIGWFYEVFLEVVVYGWGYSDRGILLGPYCTIYGFGALLFLVTAYRLIKNKSRKIKLKRLPLVFVATMLIATCVELGASYLCEMLMGSWPWQSYVDYRYHFQGRIALSPSLRFGLGGLLFLYVLQPLLEKLTGKLSSQVVDKIAISIVLVLLLDCLATIVC